MTQPAGLFALKQLKLLAFFSLIALLAVLSLSTLYAESGAPAVGGNITNLSLGAMLTTTRWFGLWGNASTTGGATNFTSLPGEVNNTDIFYPNFCQGANNYLFAANTSSINWNALARAEPSQVDAFLNVAASASDSGTNTFAFTANYVIGSTVINGVNVTYTKSYVNPQGYDLGLLQDASSGNLIFFTRLNVSGVSFNNSNATYQIMLPVPFGASNASYLFFGNILGTCGNCSYVIQPGWNLVSFCTALANNSIKAVLAPIDGEYLYIMRWDRDADHFEIYSTAAASNPFDTVDVNASYFVYVTRASAVLFNLTGELNPDMNISMAFGWNTPSYPYEFNSTVNKTTASIASVLQYVMKWNVFTNLFEIYSVEAPVKPFSDIFVGEGQFVYVKTPATLEYNRTALA
ncbi:hypothetical protein H0N96_03500 [Candidatus Micrarchaeota archaeon]|nr:hypothetical protein [Candidatus Micrarchaeota archaeon]